MVQGLGGASRNHLVYDEKRVRFWTCSFADYLLADGRRTFRNIRRIYVRNSNVSQQFPLGAEGGRGSRMIPVGGTHGPIRLQMRFPPHIQPMAAALSARPNGKWSRRQCLLTGLHRPMAGGANSFRANGSPVDVNRGRLRCTNRHSKLGSQPTAQVPSPRPSPKSDEP